MRLRAVPKEESTSAGGASTRIRMLFFPAEAFPTNRVRLTVLFGRELFGRGHEIDMVMQAQDSSVPIGRHEWSGRSVWVGRTDDGDGFVHRMRKHFLGIAHDLRWLWRARRDQYDCILVSDKYLLASVAVLFAWVRGLKVFFWLTFAFHKSQVTLGREGLVRYPAMTVFRGHLANFLLHHWIVPRSDHVFVQSQRMAEDFCAHGANCKKLTPVVTGIDVGEILARSTGLRCDARCSAGTRLSGNPPARKAAGDSCRYVGRARSAWSRCSTTARWRRRRS